MGGFSYRDVRFEPTWEADVERLRGGHPAPAPIDEVLEKFDFIVSRAAEQYPEVPGTDYRVMEIAPARGLPRLNAWFRVAEDGVVSAEHVEEAETEGEEDVEAGPQMDEG